MTLFSTDQMDRLVSTASRALTRRFLLAVREGQGFVSFANEFSHQYLAAARVAAKVIEEETDRQFVFDESLSHRVRFQQDRILTAL